MLTKEDFEIMMEKHWELFSYVPTTRVSEVLLDKALQSEDFDLTDANSFDEAEDIDDQEATFEVTDDVGNSIVSEASLHEIHDYIQKHKK